MAFDIVKVDAQYDVFVHPTRQYCYAHFHSSWPSIPLNPKRPPKAYAFEPCSGPEHDYEH